MSLALGARFGPYEVTDSIGSGGMGEVYRAVDRSLKRDVAIKVLPASLAADGDRLARFQREAEVLAALNHPSIAHIYGLETTGGVHALVMELVPGETLADRIALGPIPVAEALSIAMQIVGALEAAHEKGTLSRQRTHRLRARHSALRRDVRSRSARAYGTPVRIKEGIVRAETGQADAAQYAVSDTGSLAYLESAPGAVSRAAARRSLVWVDRAGGPQPIDLPAADYSSARISPDGKRVALVRGQTSAMRPPDLWILDLETGNPPWQLTFGKSASFPPLFRGR